MEKVQYIKVEWYARDNLLGGVGVHAEVYDGKEWKHGHGNTINEAIYDACRKLGGR